MDRVIFYESLTDKLIMELRGKEIPDWLPSIGEQVEVHVGDKWWVHAVVHVYRGGRLTEVEIVCKQ